MSPQFRGKLLHRRKGFDVTERKRPAAFAVMSERGLSSVGWLDMRYFSEVSGWLALSEEQWPVFAYAEDEDSERIIRPRGTYGWVIESCAGIPVGRVWEHQPTKFEINKIDATRPSGAPHRAVAIAVQEPRS